MSEYKIGDTVWLKAAVTDIDESDSQWPVELNGDYWPEPINIHQYESKPPALPTGKFRVRRKRCDLWVRSVTGLNDDGTLSAASSPARPEARLFDARWHSVFAAEPDRFEIVPVEPHGRPWKWDAGEKAIRSASGEFVASFGDETEHLGPLIVERVNKAEAAGA